MKKNHFDASLFNYGFLYFYSILSMCLDFFTNLNNIIIFIYEKDILILEKIETNLHWKVGGHNSRELIIKLPNKF